MRKILGFETAGSLIVIVMTILAQITALLLTKFPDSAFLWYADREIFRFVGILEHSWMLEPPAICFSVASVALTFYAYLRQWRLVAAAVSHTCLFLAGKSVYMCILAEQYYWGERFPSAPSLLREPNSVLLLVGFSAAIVSAAACHFLYLSRFVQVPSEAARPLEA
jgi:hypothetical protein